MTAAAAFNLGMTAAAMAAAALFSGIAGCRNCNRQRGNACRQDELVHQKSPLHLQRSSACAVPAPHSR
jgi:hypothetical protein